MRQLARPQEHGDLLTLERGSLGPILEAFSDVGRRQLRDLSRIRTVSAGTVVIADGQSSADVGFVIDGTLAMSKLLFDGREHILGLLLPTSFFGRLFGGPSRYSVAALSLTRLFCVPRAAFEDLLSREPRAEHLFLGRTLDELDLARESVLHLNGSRVLSRVAMFLLALSRPDPTRLTGPSEPAIIQIPLRRADLASYLGTRPETLSRVFHELEHRRMVQMLGPYRFRIVDPLALLELSGQGLASSERL